MLDLSVIILTFNEEIHIRRCIENVCAIAQKVYVVDCYSTDRTVEIAKECGAEVVMHKWPGNQADQFNWALDNLTISTQWVLRLDADEYLTSELISEFKNKLPHLPISFTGIVFKRRHIFLGKWMKRGTYPVKLLRAFRYGYGRCEHRLMDEHIQLNNGQTIEFNYDFCDNNLNDLSWFCHKHINYAVREAAELLGAEYNISVSFINNSNINIGRQALNKRQRKHTYAKLPLFWRAFAYFIYRYIFKLGFLDGKEGFLWDFLQGLWYRMLVDAKIFEIKKACGNDKEKILSMLRDKYNISI